MIAKIVFLTLCVFQVTLAQDPEQDILDLIAQTDIDINEYVNPLVARMVAFGNSFGDENRRLEAEEAILRADLQDLATQLGGGNDVSACLNNAQQDADTIFQDRQNELTAFNTLQFNSFNYVFEDLTQTGDEEDTLINQTQDEIEMCRALGTTAEVQACLSDLLRTFDQLKEGILDRYVELYEEGQRALEISEDSMLTFSNGNRQFVSESSQVTRDELTSCIQNL